MEPVAVEAPMARSRNGIASAFRLLYPGLGIKRWLGVGAIGWASLSVGLAYVLARAFASPLPTFTPPYLDGALLMALGSVLLYLSASGLARTLGPVLTSRARGEGLASAIYHRRQQERGPSVVAIGGGTGLSNLLRGLKEHTSHITAILTVADDGGSSGRLRRELGILPPGDFRNCLVALADAEPTMTRLFQYRFGQGSGLQGHSFGNLFIVALSGVTGGFEQAILESSKVLAVRGRILPSTLANVNLIAQMEDERTVKGESSIPLGGGSIKRLSLEPSDPEAYPEAVKAIEEAQFIVLGPGSLYTSIMPNILVAGVREALVRSHALKVYVCNVATQDGETDGYGVAEHIEALRNHGGDGLFQWVLVNSTPPGTLPKEWKAQPVLLNWEPVDGIGLYQCPLTNDAFALHHDPVKLAAALLKLYNDHRGHRG